MPCPDGVLAPARWSPGTSVRGPIRAVPRRCETPVRGVFERGDRNVDEVLPGKLTALDSVVDALDVIASPQEIVGVGDAARDEIHFDSQIDDEEGQRHPELSHPLDDLGGEMRLAHQVMHGALEIGVRHDDRSIDRAAVSTADDGPRDSASSGNASSRRER
jgi:hypothetical protein